MGAAVYGDAGVIKQCLCPGTSTSCGLGEAQIKLSKPPC